MLYSVNETIAREINEEARKKYAEGDRESARRKLTAALQLNPESEYVRLNIAYMDWREGNLDRAIQTLKALLASAKDPSVMADSLITLGNAYYDSEDLDAAYDYFEKVLSVRLSAGDPHAIRITADGHSGMGMVEKARGNLDIAIAHFEDCLRIHPRNACGLAHLAHCHYLKDNFAKAIEHCRLAIEVYEESPNDNPIGNDWMHLGWYYEESGDVETARDCYLKAIELGEEEARESLEELNKAVSSRNAAG